MYPFLSTAVDHQKRVLQVEGDGRLGADMFCKSKGYLKSGDFLELEEAGNIWPIGTTNLANDQFWTGANATAYLYITCLSLETQSPSIGQGENGNIGYKNVSFGRGGNDGVAKLGLLYGVLCICCLAILMSGTLYPTCRLASTTSATTTAAKQMLATTKLVTSTWAMASESKRKAEGHPGDPCCSLHRIHIPG